jgi:microsomal dipeptidase-like Zn-dependent dipeptidase
MDPDLTVELHAHLFMKEGMGWAFRGDFDGPLQATSWKNKFSSMANPETVEASRIGILVVSLYAHPLWAHNLRDSIQKQVDLARDFVSKHPNWVIATSAKDARAALASGKRVLVLSLEGADGIIDNEEDVKRFIDEDGIRIVTLLHLTDDSLGGVAFLGGFRNLADPIAWVKGIFSPHHDHSAQDVKVNPRGLTDQGRAMAKMLMDHHVWIDLSHASDASARELIEMQKASQVPLLYTHTILRRYHGAERGISDEQLSEVAASHGAIGLMPSEEYLDGTPVADSRCANSVWALARQYADVAAVMPATSIAMGSDYNGGLRHFAPLGGACATGTALDQEGLWNIGQVPALWAGLKKAGAPVPETLSQGVEGFLAVWDRVP